MRANKESLEEGSGSCGITHSKFMKMLKRSIVLLTRRVRLTHNQKCFTISEVAADWHEVMILQRAMRPSIAHVRLSKLLAADVPLPSISQSRPLLLNP